MSGHKRLHETRPVVRKSEGVHQNQLLPLFNTFAAVTEPDSW
jgi:hypothetical protein